MPNLERIRENEARLDQAAAAVEALRTALEGYRAARGQIAALAAYYRTDWSADLADDDAGLLPPGLKRGVLSQDAVFDLLAADRAVRETAEELFGTPPARPE